MPTTEATLSSNYMIIVLPRYHIMSYPFDYFRHPGFLSPGSGSSARGDNANARSISSKRSIRKTERHSLGGFAREVVLGGFVLRAKLVPVIGGLREQNIHQAGERQVLESVGRGSDLDQLLDGHRRERVPEHRLVRLAVCRRSLVGILVHEPALLLSFFFGCGQRCRTIVASDPAGSDGFDRFLLRARISLSTEIMPCLPANSRPLNRASRILSSQMRSVTPPSPFSELFLTSFAVWCK